MAKDPQILAHQEWLGYVQPVGLVVSIPALMQAQAIIDRNIIPQQQRFAAGVSQGPNPAIVDFPVFTQNVLEWQEADLLGRPGGAPVPNTLEVVLEHFSETLRPTYVVPDSQPADAARPWLMLIQELPLGTGFDDISTTDDRHWQASPQARIERLLRETKVPIGLLVNGTQIRLVYAPSGENSGHATFNVGYMITVAGRPIFAALHLLLCADRLFAQSPDRRLPALLATSRKYQSLVSNQLAEQVLAALYELVRGFQAANDVRKGELLHDVLAEDPNQVYGSLLTVLMRLVFVLYAEDRGLISTDPVYVNHYSVTGLFDRLRADAGRYPDTMDQRFGAWAQLLTLFRMVYDGGGHGSFRIPPREGYLFDPDRYSFLEGRPWRSKREAGQSFNVPRVPDGVVFRVLRNLLILDGERLSYRTLDVEQIGSVYETMMGFNLEVAQGQSIAIKPAKPHGAPATINLEALAAAEPGKRAKWLLDNADQKFTGQAAEALTNAKSIDDLLVALDRKIARNATPNTVPKGAMVLQPSDERRKSGSHYTPRSLTEPIVRKALAPVLKALGPHPTPQQLLDLKVCDLAMGSGAFLVETDRQLADELVRAWHHHKALPKIPPDEDEVLHARRLIAQRCLYGVDRNPMAVDLAKLSLWLATLAKDHPFTFLDHTLRHGDSLVGLTRRQIEDFHWLPVSDRRFGQQHVEDSLRQATAYRKRILDAGDAIPPAIKLAELAQADGHLNSVRFYGDLVIAAFFAGENERQRKAKRDELLDRLLDAIARMDVKASPRDAVVALRSGQHPVIPFHWQIEFPEVFARDNGGFDAIVGNPPFAGKNTLAGANREGYLEWLKALDEESHGNADLVAHFFRRGFALIRHAGTFGLIATNTISQGDTRTTGLRWICTHHGKVYAVRRRLRWPGQAAVVVSVVHVARGDVSIAPEIDNKRVGNITAYLLDGTNSDDPVRLIANRNKAFVGTYVLGIGFTFDDTDRTGQASSLDEMRDLISTDPHNAEVIQPFMGGEEINTDPRLMHHRYVINFGTRTEAEARRWPALFNIVEQRVKPNRLGQGSIVNPDRWWMFARPASDLYEATSGFERVLVIAQTSRTLAFAFKDTGTVFSHKMIVFALQTFAAFATMQSQCHQEWVRLFGSTMKDDPVYTPSDCFETFPFSIGFTTNTELEEIGRRCYQFRSELMLENGEGLTKTYNRFHDPEEQSPKIKTLRELHDAMDRAVLDSYGWTDIQPICEFLLDFEEEDDDEAEAPSSGRSRKKPWRYRWPDDIRDEVLARLLALNAERAKSESDARGKEKEPVRRASRAASAPKADISQTSLPYGHKGG